MSIDKQPIRTNVSVPQGQEISNNAELMLESSAIPYNNNQLADLELWDGLFISILLLRIEKFLSSDIQNITCSLLQIGIFIKQCSLRDKPAKNFLELANIGFAA